MKKFISILCVFAIIFSTSVCVFATSEADEVVVDDEEIMDEDHVQTNIAELSEEDREKIIEAAVKGLESGLLYLAEKEDQPSVADVAEIICVKLQEYTGFSISLSEVKAFLAAKGIDLSSIKVVTASRMDDIFQAVLDIIAEKYGNEADDIVYDILKNSLLTNLFAQLYIVTPEETDEETETSGQCGDNVYWSFDEETGTLTISGEGNMWDYDRGGYSIASGWDGWTIYYIYDNTPWNAYKSDMKTVIVEAGVTRIGSSAFYCCANLTNITVPTNVTSIGDEAFGACKSLVSVEIPDSVTSIGNYAFYNCSILTSITIPNSVTSIGDWAFDWCESLKSITIPDSVTSIGDGAFNGCDSLTSLTVSSGNRKYSSDSNGVLYNKDKTELIQYPIGNERTSFHIPDSVTSIGDAAFGACESLVSVEIPNSVTSIGVSAFSNCRSLTSIDIPDNVTSIGQNAFSNCYSLKSVTIGSRVTHIGSYAFRCCSSLTSIKIPDGVTYINESAFNGCSNLTSIEIPDSVISIDSAAFANCTSLTSVRIGDGVTSIGSDTFANCTSLTSVRIGDGVTSIDSAAFANCTSLTSVILPDSVTYIGFRAFDGCSSLTSITIPDSVISIEHEAFDETEYYNNSSNWENDVLYICNHLVKAKDNINSSYKVKDGTKCIADGAFEDCSSLTSIEIPDSVTNIGGGAFANCTSLTSVRIGDGVTSIGGAAFYNCSSLTSIEIPNSVRSIDYEAFYNCSSLTSIEIPNSVTSIRGATFYNCSSLTSVVVPRSVTSIAYDAFEGCEQLTIKCYIKSDTHLYLEHGGLRIPYELIEDSEGPAAAGQCGDNVYWTYDKATGVLIISGTGDIYDYNEAFDHFYPSPFEQNPMIKAVKIELGVTSIAMDMFDGCRNLTNISIPDSVAAIKSRAFLDTGYYNNDSNWENGVLYIGNHLIATKESISGSYKIKDGTKCIADGAFEDCSSLTSIEIPDSVTSIGDWAFKNCTSLTSVRIGDGVTSIGRLAFYNCSSLTSVKIGNSVERIGSYAFEDCDISGELVIPSSVKSIGYQAFEKNEKLEKLTISEGVESIGENTFALCKSLETVSIPSTIETLNYGAFYGCSSIKDVYYNGTEDRWNNLGGTEYFGLDMKQVKIHFADVASGQCGDNVYWTFDKKTGTLTIYGEGDMFDYSKNSKPEYGPFYNNSSIKSVNIESGVTSIGGAAFYNCSSLTSIKIPNSVTSIGGAAFYYCSSLTSIEIPNSVRSIDHEAFAWCESLKSITIPDSVTNIRDSTFRDCSSLTSVTICNGVTSIGRLAFYNCSSLTSVVIPKSITNIGDSAFKDCSNLTSFAVDFENDNYSSDYNGVLYNKDKTKLLLYPIGNNRSSFTIPDSVSSIGDDAFFRCINLTNIMISNRVTSIGILAFAGCSSITSLKIPDSVTRIGSSAFAGCSSLTSIEIPDSVTWIRDWTFSSCSSLTTIMVPESVTCIDYGAFNECSSLTSIEIPDSVTNIGNIAFEGCDNLSIKCHENSYAHQYAIDNEIAFELIGEHNHTLSHIEIPSTCVVAGMAYDVCTECGEIFNETVLPLAAHTWSEWVVTKEATVTEEGVETRTCSVCGEKETRSIERLKVLRDESTGVEVIYGDQFEAGVTIKTSEVFDGSSFQIVASNLGNVQTKIYDITTLKNGSKVQPTDSVKVRIPVPAEYFSGNIFIYYVNSTNGTVEKIPAVINNDYIEFEVSHFSYYALVLEEKASPSVKSVSIGDISLNYKSSATLSPQIVADDGASYTVTYTSSNPSVATVDNNGKVTSVKQFGLNRGSATITVTVTDNDGNSISDTCNVTVEYAWWQWLIKIVLFGWIWY